MRVLEPKKQAEFLLEKKASNKDFYKTVSNIVKKPYDTVRLAVKRGSFKPLEFQAIEQYFDNLENINSNTNTNTLNEPETEYYKPPKITNQQPNTEMTEIELLKRMAENLFMQLDQKEKKITQLESELKECKESERVNSL